MEPTDTLDESPRRSPSPTAADLAAAREDADDVRVARERLRTLEAEGTIPWERLKEEMGLE